MKYLQRTRGYKGNRSASLFSSGRWSTKFSTGKFLIIIALVVGGIYLLTRFLYDIKG